MADQIPTDVFSRRRRELKENPGAIGAESTITVQDFYGNLETWVVETFRVDGKEEAFLQRMSADGGARLLLPAPVMAALSRQRDQVIGRARKRSARAAAATRKAKGRK